MNIIDLSIYEKNKIYISLFDVLIKELTSNKDEFLQTQNISPTSYRNAKINEIKVGKSITAKLSGYFGLNAISIDEIKETEKLCQKIYSELYYKILGKLKHYEQLIDVELSKNNLLFPILKLFKLFLILNGTQERQNIINQNIELFKEIKKYENFYTDELKEILMAIKIIFLDTISNKALMYNYKDGLVYYTIASKMNNESRYIESLYFAKKAEEFFLKENNFFRIVYLNNICSFNYNALESYEKSYVIERNQLLSLAALGNNAFELSATRLHFIVACLGLGKYEEVVELCSFYPKIESTELYCLSIANYFCNPQEYAEILKKVYNSNLSEQIKSTLKTIDLFLNRCDKKSMKELEKCYIHNPLLIILKKIFMIKKKKI